MPIDYIGFAYATTVAAGGIIGYVKAGSIPSLGAGIIFGTVLGYGAYQTSNNPSDMYLSFGTSALLAGIMGARYYNSNKFMPAGLITIISIAMIMKFGYQYATTVTSPSHKN